MRLIYAYIRKFRNIQNQEISFSDRYNVSYNSDLPFPKALVINPRVQSLAASTIFKDSELENVHIIVGKTGAGKTNILQMIGMPEEERFKEEGASYVLIYEAESGFVAELYDIPVADEMKRKPREDESRFPERIREYSRLLDAAILCRFTVEDAGSVNNLRRISSHELNNDFTYIFNGYERHAFPYCAYEETRLSGSYENSHWLERVNAEYHRTTLWNSCRFLKEYVDSFDPDNIKRKAALVINCQNWASTIKQHIDEKLQKHDYWTFIDRIRKDEEKQFLGESVKRRKRPAIRHQFVHDLWTDYALYLREWISYIEMYPGEIPEDHLDAGGTADVYQELLDYYFEKEMDEIEEETGKKNDIDPTIVPDFENISILKRIEWLSMYIDRRGDGIAHHLPWQIYGDIRDIGEILGKFDDKYFTNTTFTIPIEEMYTEKNRLLVEKLFERMEQYRPDDTGIFTTELLPYHFHCISSGEYQFAKVLGGIEEYCVKLSTGQYGNHPNLIYLLDEPETYMHPELCRTFLKRLDKVLKERSGKNDIQILITTHSPLLLSDVLPNQITRLDLDNKGYCVIKNSTEKAYFGANIHTILSDGFFLNFTIGEYAREYLQRKYSELKKALEVGQVSEQMYQEIQTIIPLIGDSVIRMSFESLLQQIAKGGME